MIGYLTADEDLRQDLWVYYLSGNSPATFSQHLEKIKLQNNSHSSLQKILQDLQLNPPSPELMTLISHFSELEQHVMCLLMLGMSAQEISRYNGISVIRIMQVISAIKTHSGWKEWLTNGTLQTVKDTDSLQKK